MAQHLTGMIVARPGRVRDGISTLLSSLPEVDGILQFDQLEEALMVVGEQRPLLVLIDFECVCVRLPAVLNRLKTISPGTRHLVLVGNHLQQHLAKLSNADRILMKGVRAETFIEVVGELVSSTRDSLS